MWRDFLRTTVNREVSLDSYINTSVYLAIDIFVSSSVTCPSCGISEALRALLGAESPSVLLLAKVQLF
jgi:hypothetical protein